MTRKLASNTNVAVTFYVTFNLISFVPLFMGAFLASKLTSNVWLFILVNCLLVSPVPYFALKFSAQNLNKNYIVTDKNKVISSVLKYLLTLNGLFLILNFYFIGYISANMIVGAFTVILAALTIYKFAAGQIQETTEEEIVKLLDLVKEPALLKSIGRTALLTILGFVFLLVVPLLSFVFVADNFGGVTLLEFIAYFIVVIFLFKKVFFREQK